MRLDLFKSTKDETDQKNGREAIFSAGDWAKRMMPDESTYSECLKQWAGLCDLLVEKIMNVKIPCVVSHIPKDFGRAMSCWKKAKEHIENRNYSEAIGQCYIACEYICRFEFWNGNKGHPSSLRQLLEESKKIIKDRYGPITYSYLRQIIDKRHSRGAAHPADEKPTLMEAQEILDNTKHVINRFHNWRNKNAGKSN